MRLSSVFLTAALSGIALAWPPGPPHPPSPSGRPSFCLSNADAKQIGDDFALLISAYNATFANLVLANDYTDQSDSVNTLIDSGTTGPIPVSFSCQHPLILRLSFCNALAAHLRIRGSTSEVCC